MFAAIVGGSTCYNVQKTGIAAGRLL